MKDEKFLINGGNKLFGEVVVDSSKNAYLPILAGCVLSEGKIVLHKCPNFSDINSMCDILRYLGAKVEKIDDILQINCDYFDNFCIPTNLASKVRSSIFMLGAILGRFKKAKVAYPGGCEIGIRPIDLHIKGLKKLGVKIVEKHGYIYCDGSNMTAGTIVLDFASVVATENIMMGAVLTKGTTKIYNPAKEPEIVDLQNFLNKLGAKITGAGGDVITIEGVEKLQGKEYTPISDRIIAGTYIIACAMCGGDITIKNVNPNHNIALITKIDKYACKIDCFDDKIRVIADGRPKSLGRIETQAYPGMPTDLQSQILALQTISKGSCLIVENLFETRFKHVPELIKMGADIHLRDRIAFVTGKEKLYGADVVGMDLRGTASLTLAGLVAEGYTTVYNVHHLDRGYDCFEKALQNLGADIKRIS